MCNRNNHYSKIIKPQCGNEETDEGTAPPLDNEQDDLVTNNCKNTGCTNTCYDNKFPVELEEAQSKFKRHCIGLTMPRNRALRHPAASLLSDYAINGCPADCGEDWSIEMMEAAIAKGTHKSAETPQAAEYCWAEAKDKEKIGQVRLVKWSDIKHDPPAKLKMSPIATAPHKSRSFRLILDLSFNINIRGTKHKSVNEASVKLAPQRSMGKLGTVTPRFIEAVANAPMKDGPINFAKFDTKDGHWRMAI